MGMKVKPSGVSQNVAWTDQKGSWLIHMTITFLLLVILAQIFGINKAIQLTILFYNCITFIFFHWIIGDPFEERFEGHTFWEQMTEQLEYSESTLFVGLYPAIIFIIGNHLVVWNKVIFYASLFSLCLVMIPKLGFMHGKRIFGLRRKKSE